jgi:uncharacterized protein YndB with AHSA1/START domain
MHDAVTVHMAASPEQVWDLVADVTKIGRYSPETFEAEWLDGATGPDVGVRFRGHVKRNGRGPTYWTECSITTCEPQREFAFRVGAGAAKHVNTWRYQLEPVDGGTDVTESFQLAPTLPLRVYWAVFGRWRGKTNRDGMRDTLEAIRAEVERSDAT